jgi:DNA-binding transcriptional LysR family regulator
MPISLRTVKSFVTVADLGSFRKAAEELSVSQPSLSARVRELEDELGMRLLRRTTRQVRLTENGELFLARVRRTLEDFDSVIAAMKEQATIQRGRTIVACVPSIAANVLPSLLVGFAKENPGIAVRISDDRAEVIEHRVRRGEVDFAISSAGDRSSELEFDHIVDDAYFAVFPSDHPLAQRQTVTLKRFNQYPLVLMRPGLNMRQVLDEAAARAGVALRPAYEVYHHDTLTGIVAAGLGIGAMPRMTVSMVRHPRLAMARIVEPAIARSIGILKRRGEPLLPAAQKLVDATRSFLLAAAEKPQRPASSRRQRHATVLTTGSAYDAQNTNRPVDRDRGPDDVSARGRGRGKLSVPHRPDRRIVGPRRPA